MTADCERERETQAWPPPKQFHPAPYPFSMSSLVHPPRSGWSAEEALRFWFGRINYEQVSPRPSDLKLDRMRALLDALGNPQERLRIIHIAGSKGKGSTSAMLAAILRSAGYRTGLFTSPHLEDVHERIQVNGVNIGEEEMTSLLEEISASASARAWPPASVNGQAPTSLAEAVTFFEIATALGFLHFVRRRVDFAVVEVGLGGRFDSTNVCTPLLSIITSISFDHTQQLGKTLEKIAMEKAGIIKPGRPVLSGVRAAGPRQVIEKIAAEREAPLIQAERDFRFTYEPGLIGVAQDSRPRVQVETRTPRLPAFELGLLGEHQAANAAVVVAAVEQLRLAGIAITDSAVANGLATVCWPARLEIVGRQPLVILDCAHNVASAQALADTLLQSIPLKPNGQRHLIFAGNRDKDLKGMLAVLAPHFAKFFLTRFGTNPRNVAPEKLAEFLPAGAVCSLHETAAAAWAAARQQATPNDLICITGSVFLAGELRRSVLS